MANTISEIPYTNTSTNTDVMIPVFIAKRKSLIIENLTLVNNDINTIQISQNDNIVDPDSFIPNITYWETTSDSAFITNDGSIVSNISISIPIYSNFNNKSLFVVYDDSNNLIFISSIKDVVYSSINFISATLDIPITFNGNYNCGFIHKNTQTIPVDSFNASLNQLSINWNNINIFYLASNNLSPILFNQSTISYIITSKKFEIKQYETITENDINNEYNNILKEAFQYTTTGCIVISYPDDSYFQQLLDILHNSLNGYFITPIDISSVNYESLSQYISSLEGSSQFLSLLIKPTFNLNDTLTSSSFTMPVPI